MHIKQEPEIDLGLLVLPPSQFVESTNGQEYDANVNQPKVYQCDLCSFSSNYKIYMKLHLDDYNLHQNIECEFCEGTWHLRGNKKCLLCLVEFGCRSLLQKHNNEVHEKNDKSLETPSNRPRQAHTKESINFECDLCNFKTIYKSNLQFHVEIHSGNCRKCFSCYRCGKQYFSRIGLTHHLKTISKK